MKDRQTERQTEKQTERQTERKTENKTENSQIVSFKKRNYMYIKQTKI